MKLRTYKILKKTNVEGPGLRYCIWVQGCPIHCDGCMNVDTWSFESGILLDVEKLILDIKKQEEIEGITILGGEPFCQGKELAYIFKRIKNETNLSILCFSGYEYEYILKSNKEEWNKMLRYIDLLIDGPYIKDKRDFSRPWVGSSNQNYRFLSKRYENMKNNISDIKNKVEVRVSKNGSIFINGMGEIEKIKESVIKSWRD
ncbi:anaerobic ribonucleoside-triphosphate reductase activating protein [Clostridium chrysemydis]|uniref:anaerobic ribonucleoside-triphosphate reductase activating protein n=1 Tax=Clostridium chrysemydis TaxID=2665504 RepID=UPI0018845704|nr:anaerobic ribonucleoside-triphosphate reductase activating protein [Clostridium chrysemydis]